MLAGIEVHFSSLMDYPDLPEIVEDGETGLVVANSAAAIASAIRRLIQDPSLAARLGDQGRRRVERHFTVDALVERTLHFYQEVLAC